MKQLTELTKYVITPNVRFYGGFVYDGEDIFLCDDKDEDEDFKLHIKQRIVNNILITDGEKEYQTLKGKRELASRSRNRERTKINLFRRSRLYFVRI